MRCLPFLAALILAACASESEPVATFVPLGVDDLAPVFTRSTLDGDAVRIGPGEVPTLLNLWATWCGPCIEEFPDLEQIHQELGPELRVVALNVDELDDEAVREFSESLGATFPILLDPPGSVQDQYRVIGLPSTFLVNERGLLDAVWTGRIPPDAMQQIKVLLDE